MGASSGVPGLEGPGYDVRPGRVALHVLEGGSQLRDVFVGDEGHDDRGRLRERGRAEVAARGAEAPGLDLRVSGDARAFEGDLDLFAALRAREHHEHLHASSSAGGEPAALMYM